MKTQWLNAVHRLTMNISKFTRALIAEFLLILGICNAAHAESLASQRKAAQALQTAGNYSEALEVYRKLLAEPGNLPEGVTSDLGAAVVCLGQLGRQKELDELVEKVVIDHGKSWRVLHAAASVYESAAHYGVIISGKFERGAHNASGRYVTSAERDRVRALQLRVHAMTLLGSAREDEKSNFYYALAESLTMRGRGGYWQLQTLTAIDALPDFEEGHSYHSYPSAGPVSEEGKPIVFEIPEDWEKAANDGERWRWALAKSSNTPEGASRADLHAARTINAVYGVQTLAGFASFRHQGDPDNDLVREEEIAGLEDLRDEESSAKLAIGTKRFELPEHSNPIKLLNRASAPNNRFAREALGELAAIFENRRQLVRAAEIWREQIRRFGGDEHNTGRLQQITGKFCRFEPVSPQPAGKEVNVALRFRNAKSVRFEAYEIKFDTLVADMKKNLSSSGRPLSWDEANLRDLGYRLVQREEKKYLGSKSAAWELQLDPDPNHGTKRQVVNIPVQVPGPYLLVATTDGGNKSRIVLWLTNLTLMRKTLEDGSLFIAADSRNGKPVGDLTLEFFGYSQGAYQVSNGKRVQGEHHVSEYTLKTASDGSVAVPDTRYSSTMQWLTTARAADGSLAFLGFDYVHKPYRESGEGAFPGRDVAVAISDRPSYRPGQTVHYKLWMARAQYDGGSDNPYAGKQFSLNVTNPLGEKFLERTVTSDEFGGISGSFSLEETATLGAYHLSVSGTSAHLTFRVEEYKKPEFEVKVHAPSDPVTLGESFKAAIEARYYFGSPVASGRVKYKVMRHVHTNRWFVPRPWDWLYGKGYWWSWYDYRWFPGWSRWGCEAPWPFWYPHPAPPPEIIAENEVAIGKDGRVEINVDTSEAAKIHSDKDHRYEITAEVVDESRRSIHAQGSVYVTRKPFEVSVWTDRGFYRSAGEVSAYFSAVTPDGKPVKAEGKLKLFRISYSDGEASEEEVQSWPVDLAGPYATMNFQLPAAGQYRLALELKDEKNRASEGGVIFSSFSDETDDENFAFNPLEIVADKPEYTPGEKMRLRINAQVPGSTVFLFVRPVDGIYSLPRIVELKGKSAEVELEINKSDMPNFFVEAITVQGGKVHTELKRIVVPPEKKILQMTVTSDKMEYAPGENVELALHLAGPDGSPFVGSTVVSVYDRALEYISGGSNVPDIREAFWKWQRNHRPLTSHSQEYATQPQTPSGETGMMTVGLFGEASSVLTRSRGAGLGAAQSAAAPVAMKSLKMEARDEAPEGQRSQSESAGPQISIRKEFADTAYWSGTVTTDSTGSAKLTFKAPENLTGWKIRGWSVGKGAEVGLAEGEIVTKKDLLIRTQIPRFLQEKDEVVLSANVHNYTPGELRALVEMKVPETLLSAIDGTSRTVILAPGGEERVDFRVRVLTEGIAAVQMTAVTDTLSDGMEVKVPVQRYGILKTESFSGSLPGEAPMAQLTFRIPEERDPARSRMEIRLSPSLAVAVVEALPYLIGFEYDCTEQTLNRFLPAVLARKMLDQLGVRLEDIGRSATNFNSQQVGDPGSTRPRTAVARPNPVFDERTLAEVTKKGLERLAEMQLSDGGWGWFTGYREYSTPHTTGLVFRGLLRAREAGLAVDRSLLERGLTWLKSYRDEQWRRLSLPESDRNFKSLPDEADVFVHYVLAEASQFHPAFRDRLVKDRNSISVYGKTLLALALLREGRREQMEEVHRNIRQYLQRDEENQTSWLALPDKDYWWYWFGSSLEANAHYLMLLNQIEPEGSVAAGLSKFLVNNRRHGNYWTSTRDTAFIIEALVGYVKASGEGSPEMQVEVLLDGKTIHTADVNSETLFAFDHSVSVPAEKLSGGTHTIEVRKKGKGNLYYNAYSTYFSREDSIAEAGLEVKVKRRYYLVTPGEKSGYSPSDEGRPVSERRAREARTEIFDGHKLASGDIVQVELEVQSKNDYEYLMFEDNKAAGFEALSVQSGYSAEDGLPAYVEYRDRKVTFFLRQLPQGTHNLQYRLRAETPGTFVALPTLARGMYAEELRANSANIKLAVSD